SIKRVQIIGALQERFPHLPVLGPEKLGTLRSLDQIVTELAAAQPAPADNANPVGAGNGAIDAADAPSGDALRRALREVVANKTGYPVEMVDPAMDLEADLGVDSIKRVQIIGALQERFPHLPVLGPEKLGTLRSLDHIVGELAGGGVDPKAEAAAETPRHVVELVELPAPDLAVDLYSAAGVAVLVGLDESADADCEALDAELRAGGWTVIRAQNPGEIPGTEPVDICVMVAGVATEWEQAQRILSDAILVAGQVVPCLRRASGRAGFSIVTRLDGHLGMRGDAEPVAALLGGLGGVVKSLVAEQPSLFCRALDIDPSVSPHRMATHVLEELCDTARDTPEVGIDDTGVRRAPVPGLHGPAQKTEIIRAGDEFQQLLLTASDVVLVTGGARGVTATCVLELARVAECRFLLLGRTALVPDPKWAQKVADPDLKPTAVHALAGSGVTPKDIDRACAEVRAAREIRATLAGLGDRVQYLTVDVTDTVALTEALAPWRHTITGVVHGAGVLADSLIPDKTAESIERVLRPKLAGLGAVLAAIGDPRHLVLFTSVAGLFGNAGQADYAAANEALSRFAVSWGRRNPDRHVTAIDWGAWDGGMVTPTLREHFSARGIPLLAPAAGAAAFTAQFTTARREEPVLLVGAAKALSTGDPVVTPLRARRGILGLTEEPVLAAHRIGEHIVLPATFGLGAMVHLIERTAAGLIVVGAREFQVLRGVVFDQPMAALDIELIPIAPVNGRAAVRATVFGDSLPRFRAVLLLADGPDSAPHQHVPAGPGASAAPIYRDAVLFHGPALQGLRAIRAQSDDALVLECALPTEWVANGAYAGRLHDPVLADLILQAPAVLGHRLLGTACLPLSVGSIDYHAPLPADDPFLVVVDNPRVAQMEATIDATALTLNGSVLQRFSDVTVLTTPDMTDKFRASTKEWLA
ncbi:KR domain-containing protein, partial [Nocardia sp. NPDC059195]